MLFEAFLSRIKFLIFISYCYKNVEVPKKVILLKKEYDRSWIIYGKQTK